MLRGAIKLIAGALLVCGAQAAAAQDYPNRSVRFVQGFAPGGNADAIVRIISEDLSKALGQTVVVEARPGAAGNIASEQIARGPADGYSIVLLTTAHVISPALYKSQKFDPVKDFSFITKISDLPFFIVVNANSPYKTIGDLVKAAKSKPGALTVGTAGVGTGQHMTSELFANALGTKFVHVPYKGDSGAVAALLGNNVDFIIAPGAAILGNIQGGKFRALAISSKERWAPLPGVPTVAETVVPNFEVTGLIAVATAAKVPEPIIARLNKEIRKIVADPKVVERLRALGLFPKTTTPEEMTEVAKSQIAQWKDVAEKANIPKR